MHSLFRHILRATLLAVVVAGLAPSRADASPIANVTYVEQGIGGGLFQYDVTIANLTDPAEAGADLFWLTLSFAPSISLVSANTPADWVANGGAGFIDAFSLIVGAMPGGTDIGPGQQLGGFSFVLDGQLGASAFQALFVNPADPFSPFVLDGVTTAAPTGPAPVPEPATLVLVGSGAAVLLARRRQRTVKV